jgi:hypothetical protein
MLEGVVEIREGRERDWVEMCSCSLQCVVYGSVGVNIPKNGKITHTSRRGEEDG